MANAGASGIFYSVSAVYFTRVVGLTATTVGIGLTVAGGVGVLGAFVAGALSDRWGALPVMMLATLGQGVALLGYAFTSTAASFAVVACLAVGMKSVQQTARNALVARSFTGPERVRVRARLRVVLNLFIGLGTCVAAVALLVDTAAGYTWAIALVGGLSTASCLPLVRQSRRRSVPATVPRSGAARGTWVVAATNRQYLALTLLNAVLVVHFGLQIIGVPLWVVMHTDAPAVVVAVLMVLNTVLVTLLQVPASRGTDEVPGAARAVRRAGGLLVLACAAYALAGSGGPLAATCWLLLAGALHSVAEVWADAGTAGLAFELADDRFPGAYQGLSQTGVAVGSMVAPVLVTAALDRGSAGWAVLALVFGLTAVLIGVVARSDVVEPVPAPGDPDPVRIG